MCVLVSIKKNKYLIIYYFIDVYYLIWIYYILSWLSTKTVWFLENLTALMHIHQVTFDKRISFLQKRVTIAAMYQIQTCVTRQRCVDTMRLIIIFVIHPVYIKFWTRWTETHWRQLNYQYHCLRPNSGFILCLYFCIISVLLWTWDCQFL